MEKPRVYDNEGSRNTRKNIMTPFYTADNITLWNDDIMNMTEQGTTNANLVITSPPYNIGIEYDTHNDEGEWKDYTAFTQNWLEVLYAITDQQCRLAINVPMSKTKGGRHPVLAMLTNEALKAGFNYFTTLIWNKDQVANRTTWGSFQSANAPHIVPPTEAVLIIHKGEWQRHGGTSTITKLDFVEATYGLWNIKPVNKAGNWDHPAGFPIELPRRLIQLLSYKEDTIYDSFAGAGTTLEAALTAGRKAVGTEVSKTYCQTIVERIQQNCQPGLWKT